MEGQLWTIWRMCLCSPGVTGLLGRTKGLSLPLWQAKDFFLLFWGSWQQLSLCGWNAGKCVKGVTVWTSIIVKSHSYRTFFMFKFHDNVIQFSSFENCLHFCFLLYSAEVSVCIPEELPSAHWGKSRDIFIVQCEVKKEVESSQSSGHVHLMSESISTWKFTWDFLFMRLPL